MTLGVVEYQTPVLVQSIVSPWSTPLLRRTISTEPFDVAAGDMLIAFGLCQNQFIDTYEISGGLLSWTQAALENDDPGAGNTQGIIKLSTAVVDTPKRMTVTLERDTFAGIARFGVVVLVFQKTQGIGHIAKKVEDDADPEININVFQPHSGILIGIVDNNAENGAGRVWRETAGAITEIAYFLGDFTVYCGYHPHVPAPKQYTVGLFAPIGQQYSMIAAEILGKAVPDKAVDIIFQ